MVDGLHPINAVQSWVSEVYNVVEQTKVNLVKAQAWKKCYYNKHKVDIEFSMGNKVLLSTKDLNVNEDRKLVSHYVEPFFLFV